MGTRTIGLRDEVYDRLAAEKREGESFSDLVARLLDEAEGDWRHGFGSLDEEAAAELDRLVADQRAGAAAALSGRQSALLDRARSADAEDDGDDS